MSKKETIKQENKTNEVGKGKRFFLNKLFHKHNTLEAEPEKGDIIEKKNNNIMDYYFNIFPKKKSTFNVVLNNDALIKSLVYYSVAQFKENREVMGWLLGHKKDKTIVVCNTLVGECYSSSAYTETDPRNTIQVAKQAKKEGLEIVGQWHCHPGMSTHPSHTDVESMRTLDKFGVKNPISLIVNDENFYIGVYEFNDLIPINFTIPSKSDNKTELNITPFINREMYNYNNYELPQDDTFNNIPDIYDNNNLIKEVLMGLVEVCIDLVGYCITGVYQLIKISLIGIYNLFDKGYDKIENLFDGEDNGKQEIQQTIKN